MAKPTYCSSVPRTVDVEEYRKGLELLKFGEVPQGLTVAKVVQSKNKNGSPKHRTVAVQMPRRSTKTTTLTALILGRMASRKDYRVISTAQTGDIARRIYRDVVMTLDAAHVGVPEGERPYHARVANGTEVLTWKDTGSTWRPVTPNPLAYRSAAADLLLFDEAGHIDPQTAADLRAGAFPTTDTRPGAQIIITGTPNEKLRAGMLWDALKAGRDGKPGYGVVDFCLKDEESLALEDGTLNVPLLRRVHPGIASGLTTVAVMRERFESMPLASFEAEYGGKWALDGGAGAVPMTAWAAAVRPAPAVPDRFAWSFSVAPDASSAAVCAAWRDDDGVAHVEVLKHALGSDWVPKFAHAGYAKHRVPVGYESLGAQIEVAQSLEAMRNPRPKTTPLMFRRDVQPAQLRFVQELANGRLVHHDQAALNAAVTGARWKDTESGRSFIWSRSESDIAPLVAAANALWLWDQGTARKRPTGTGAW